MTINKLAIIGGSGLYDVEEFKSRELIKLDTPWGSPSDEILKTNYNNKEVFFLPRHGRGHFISPSNINFRANIDALKQLGVTDIVSVSAVGSLKEDLQPGKFVIVDQFIDRTFARIKTFFEEEYFPNTRKGLGVSTVPNGKEFYQNRINFYTTSTKYNAEDIHQIGLKEVARIKAEMLKIIKDLGFKGTFADFLKFLRTDEQFYAKTPKELLMFARDIAKRIDAELPKYFITLPRKPYGVVPVPAAIAPNYTGGRYSGSRSETTAGFYWVNTYNLPSRTLYTIPALTAHEAVPGHHLQMSLNNELPKTIPSFRRNLYLSAFDFNVSGTVANEK